MATETYAAELGEIRTASTAGGGTALTTTAAFVVLPIGTHWLSLTARNFATAVVAKFAINPYCVVLKTTDLLAAIGNLTDASENCQDGLTATVLNLNSLDTLANSDAVYVGVHLPIRGLRVIIGNTNGNAATLTVTYWNGTAWTDISATDGTASGGATFGQTGNITWTIPTTWQKASLASIFGTLGTAMMAPAVQPASLVTPYLWLRLETSAAFDATVTATGLFALNRDTAQYGELVSGQALEMTVKRGPGGSAVVEALTDAGTANLIVNVAARATGGGLA